MMKSKICLLLLLFTTVCFSNPYSTDPPADSLLGWQTTAGIGLDLGQLLVINPRPGSGQNSLGLGGNLGITANYKGKGKFWENSFSWNGSVQKLGSGVLETGGERIPFQKNLDEFRIGSKYGIATSAVSKFFYAIDFSLLSQILSSYAGTDNQVYLKEINSTNLSSTNVSHLLAPAYINLSLGMEYKASPALSVYFSPAAMKLILITSDEIAQLGIHGNQLEDENDPSKGYKQSDVQLGTNLKLKYLRKFLEDKLHWSSGLSLYSNYLREPQNIDIDWVNELAVALFKNVQLSLQTSLLYDHDIKVQISDRDAPGGFTGELGRRVSFTEQLSVKYSRKF